MSIDCQQKKTVVPELRISSTSKAAARLLHILHWPASPSISAQQKKREITESETLAASVLEIFGVRSLGFYFFFFFCGSRRCNSWLQIAVLPLTASLPLLLESAGRSDTNSTEQRPKSQEVTSQPLETRVMNHDWGS
jgi:hypothetical protein